MPSRSIPNSAGETVALSHRQILYIMSGLLMGVFLGALDQTIVATSIRTIADDFNNYTAQAWVTTAYLVTSTIVTPLYGKLSDIFGRKTCYLMVVGLFVVGSLTCTFAMSMYQLAAFRALQGLGAGGLMSLAFTILGDIVAPRERARYQGYFIATLTGSGVLGPLVGGLFANAHSVLGITGWRWVFLINVPLGVLALLVVHRVLQTDHRRRERVRIDWFGSLVLAMAIVPLLVVAELGQTWGWASVRSVVCFVVCGLGIVAFVLVEKLAGENALMPLRIFRNVRFAQGILLSFIVGVLLLGAVGLLPQYFQVVRGADPTRGGLLMLPVILGSMAGALLSGRIIAWTGQYRIHSIVGGVCTVLGLFALHFVSSDTNLPGLLVLTLVLGLGLGSFNQPITLVMQNILPARDMGVSTAAVMFFRQIGGTVGVAVTLSLWFALSPSAITRDVGVSLGQPAFHQALAQVATGANGQPARHLAGALLSGHTAAARGVVDNTAVLQQVPNLVTHPFTQGFAESMGTVFLGTAVLALIGLAILVGWKTVPLRSSSGRQEAARERAAAAVEQAGGRPAA